MLQLLIQLLLASAISECSLSSIFPYTTLDISSPCPSPSDPVVCTVGSSEKGFQLNLFLKEIFILSRMESSNSLNMFGEIRRVFNDLFFHPY